MAKYDTYTLSVQLGKDENRANLSLTVLFEEGDIAVEVMADVRDAIALEAADMKQTKFLKAVEQ